MIATCDIACCLIVFSSKNLIERLLYFGVIGIWDRIDLSEDELSIARYCDHHDVIFIGDLGIRPHISSDFYSLQSKGVSIIEPLHSCRRQILSNQSFEVAKGKWKDEEWFLRISSLP
jgi:hypothetical protein